MFKIFSLLLLLTFPIYAQNGNNDFSAFDAEGKAVTMEQIVSAAGRSDVVFLGEMHDDAVAHRLQLEIFRRVAEANKTRPVALSLEMFERDVQIVLDEYLSGLISETHFLSSSRPWKNYESDYRPLVEYSRQNHLPVMAANAPRRYVNMVTRVGRESLQALSPEAKSRLAPLPYGKPSKAYREKFTGAMQGRAHENSNLLQAQALWDATMAHSIATQLKKQPNSLVVHLNGAFHSESRLGTVEHLLQYAPDTKVLVVTMRPEADFQKFDTAKHRKLGDFVVLTQAKTPKPQDK